MGRILAILFLISLNAFASDVNSSMANDPGAIRGALSMKQEILAGRIAERTNDALGAIIAVAVFHLRQNGYNDDADQLENDWETKYDGELIKMAHGEHLIGDHQPLSVWLGIAYELIELKLGRELCEELHISDIKTINFCVPVVFHPCTFAMDLVTIPRIAEYRNHFDTDGIYEGLAPVLTYWAVQLGCGIATYGAGYFFICSPLAGGAEWLMSTRIAPRLSDRIFDRACGN